MPQPTPPAPAAPQGQSGPPGRPRGGVAVWAGLVVLAFALAAFGPILAGMERGRGFADQVRYHERVVRSFASQWPDVDVSDYLSATTPGYHLLLATVVKLGVTSTSGLQIASLALTLVLLGTLTWACARRAGVDRGTGGFSLIPLIIPFAASLYVYQAGVWLLPDNLGWLGVLAILLLALRPRFDRWTLVLGGIFLLSVVLVRQIHLWAAAPLWAAAWLGSDAPERAGFPELFSRFGRRVTRALLAIGVSLPAVGVLLWFRSIWDGLLIPPVFRDWYATGVNLATPAFGLSLMGGFSLFFVARLLPRLEAVWRTRRWVVLGAVAGALVVALASPTTYSTGDGRFSGLWNVVRLTPTIGGYASPVILVMTCLGALALVAWMQALPFRERWILLGAFVAFLAAQTASPQCWQRYHEPLVLMLIAIMASGVPRLEDPSRLLGLADRAGPWMLVMIQVGITSASMATADPVTRREPGEWMEAVQPAARESPSSVPRVR